uniref:Uncharacterized protein n=1 Tax=Ditylenchus dipsaci TaxID=166011 RepID=A0A915CZ93_9BILA
MVIDDKSFLSLICRVAQDVNFRLKRREAEKSSNRRYVCFDEGRSTWVRSGSFLTAEEKVKSSMSTIYNTRLTSPKTNSVKSLDDLWRLEVSGTPINALKSLCMDWMFLNVCQPVTIYE